MLGLSRSVAVALLASTVALAGCSSHPSNAETSGAHQVEYPEKVTYVRIRGEVRAPGPRTSVDIFPGVYFAPSRAELKVPGIDLLDPVPDATVTVQLLRGDDQPIGVYVGGASSTDDPQSVTTSAHGVFSFEAKPHNVWDDNQAAGLQLTCTAPGRAAVHATVRSREAQLDPAAGTPAGPDGPWFLIVLDDAAKVRDKK